jgi:hypothetical protein
VKNLEPVGRIFGCAAALDRKPISVHNKIPYEDNRRLASRASFDAL